jgi:hypothetical protein
MRLGLRTETFSPGEDHTWLGSAHATDTGEGVNLDGDALLLIFTNGIAPSGIPIVETATGFTLFDDTTTSEVQTITRTATSGDFTIAHEGKITGEIPAAAATTAATVQAAVDAAGIPAVVTGADGGPWTLTFNDDAGNVALATVDDSDASGGTVVIAQGTQGDDIDGTTGRAGHLLTTKDISGGGNVPGSLMWHGSVVEAKLPRPVTAAFKALVPQIHYK